MNYEKKIHGNVSGVRDSMLAEMCALYDLRTSVDEFAEYELLARIAAYTAQIRREISVYIARDGRVFDVSIGENDNVAMPTLRLVRNTDRLCGVRCIHTHPSGNPMLSGVDLGTLRSSLLDAMSSVGVREDGSISAMYVAYVGDIDDSGERNAKIYGPLRAEKLPHRLLLDEIAITDANMRKESRNATQDECERAITVGTDTQDEYDSTDELAELAKTAGATVVHKFVQKKRAIDNATYIGSGKVEELSRLATSLQADLIIFDDELSAVQLKNLEEQTSCRVIDRTALILDIFAGRATSREGKLQVELAQQKYRLPRLIGQGNVLSRLGGGIGTRGPGEKKLEMDRRRIRRRIYELEQELAEVSAQRGLRRAKRDNGKLPLVALVGYTNAGKSTLINALSGSEEYVCDQLFATLDPVVRKITLPSGREILASDTVGFINKLPHDLVNAFRSTLEEVCSADLILHVVDASSETAEMQIDVVESVLTELSANSIPKLLVKNKSDKNKQLIGTKSGYEASIEISALNNDGIDELKKEIERAIIGNSNTICISVPYEKYDVMSYIRTNCCLLSEEHTDTGTNVTVIVDDAVAGKIAAMLKERG